MFYQKIYLVFLAKQSKADKKLYYCRRCLNYYRTQEKLDNHTKLCDENVDAQKAIYPNIKNKYIKFINYKNQLQSIFVLYADFEAINEKNKIT